MIVSTRRRWSPPPLPVAAATLALGLYVADLQVRLVGLFVSGNAGLDFGYDLSAARIGLRHGWAALYDRELYGAVTSRR